MCEEYFCANLPTFGLYSSLQGKINSEQLSRAENCLWVKVFDGPSPSVSAGEPPCLLMAAQSCLGPRSFGKLSTLFVFTGLLESDLHTE